MPDDVDEELRDFRRKAWRTIHVLYVMMMLVYVAAAAVFFHEREWGSFAQIVTLAIGVSLTLWFSRAVARIKGDL